MDALGTPYPAAICTSKGPQSFILPCAGRPMCWYINFPITQCFLNFFFLIGVQLLYNVVLVSAVQQSESAICIHISPPSWTSLPPHTPPIPPTQVKTEHGAELPALYSRLPLAICFTHGSVYMSIPIPQFIPHHLPHRRSTRPFSTSVSLFLPCKWVHLYHFSRFHIYALIYNICFSLTYFTLYDRLQVHPRLLTEYTLNEIFISQTDQSMLMRQYHIAASASLIEV